MMTNPLTPRHCRTARAWLRWTQKKLSKEAMVAPSTIADYERGARNTDPEILQKIHLTFLGQGLRFSDRGISDNSWDFKP